MWYIQNTTLKEDGGEKGGVGDKHKVCNAYNRFLQLGPITQ